MVRPSIGAFCRISISLCSMCPVITMLVARNENLRLATHRAMYRVFLSIFILFFIFKFPPFPSRIHFNYSWSPQVENSFNAFQNIGDTLNLTHICKIIRNNKRKNICNNNISNKVYFAIFSKKKRNSYLACVCFVIRCSHRTETPTSNAPIAETKEARPHLTLSRIDLVVVPTLPTDVPLPKVKKTIYIYI